jgi:hypothetical protein
MNDITADQDMEPLEQELPEIEEPAPEPIKFSGLMSNVFPDGTIEYDGKIGTPEGFPLTEAELTEATTVNQSFHYE